MGDYERQLVGQVWKRLVSEPHLLQLITGPRQVGKTTAARALERRWPGPVRFAAADQAVPPGPEWIETHWQLAREQTGRTPALLVLDEVQKVRGWSETVKALWDQDRRAGRSLQVLLLGSSALLLARGVSESLAGRFFLHRCPHWSFAECRAAFGWSLAEWLYFGGYPGAAALREDEPAWRAYVADALIETVLNRDVLALRTVAKPALLRQLFMLAAGLPAQIISYTKLIGQLQDAGNTTTLAQYLRLLEQAYLASALTRHSAGQARQRGSIPKLILWNNALVNALGTISFSAARQDLRWWGRLVENAAGAHLLNHLQGLPYQVDYWRERDDEVDYVVSTGRRVLALEVKSGRPGRLAGLAAFKARYPRCQCLVVGGNGMTLEEFFTADPRDLLR